MTGGARIATYPYVREGMEHFLRDYGPTQYHSIAEYQKAVGQPIRAQSDRRRRLQFRISAASRIYPARDRDRSAGARRIISSPRRRALAIYLETMDRLKLDAYVYPPIQMPPPDDTMPQDGKLCGGPAFRHRLGQHAGRAGGGGVGGFYAGGLPYGLEFSGRPWRDGDLLGLAYGYRAGDASPPSAGAGGAGIAGERAVI